MINKWTNDKMLTLIRMVVIIQRHNCDSSDTESTSCVKTLI